MFTVQIKWWLGNQMFQYALGKSIAKKHHIPFCLDTSIFEKYKLHKYCLEVFNIDKNYAWKKGIPFYQYVSSKNKYINFCLLKFSQIAKKINPHHICETHFNYNPSILPEKSWYIEGYFQSEQYFLEYENDIRKNFEFIIPPSEKNKETIQHINSIDSVSIHIRRWDYVSNKNTNQFHGTCGLDYYKKAIKYIQKEVQSPTFFIFSDDIDWVKDNLIIEEHNSEYIDWNDAETNYEDMRLMSHCKHNIIANSSFSWWGAWLNKNPNKIVIAPKKWFQSDTINYSDVVPESWTKI